MSSPGKGWGEFRGHQEDLDLQRVRRLIHWWHRLMRQLRNVWFTFTQILGIAFVTCVIALALLVCVAPPKVTQPSATATVPPVATERR